MSVGSAGAGKQNAQLCATRSATQGGAIPRHNGGTGAAGADQRLSLSVIRLGTGVPPAAEYACIRWMPAGRGAVCGCLLRVLSGQQLFDR